MGWQRPTELIEKQLGIVFRFGVAGEDELSAIGGRKMDLEHLDGRKLFQHLARGETRGLAVEFFFEADVEAIGPERDEAVRLNPACFLVKNRTDRQIALEVFDRRFDLDELKVKTPELGGVGSGPVGAEQIAAFPLAGPAQCGFV